VSSRRTILASFFLVACWCGCREEVTTDLNPSLRTRLVRLAMERAEDGDVSAHAYLGWCHATGSGVMWDAALAERNLAAASKGGTRLAGRLLQNVREVSGDKRLAKCVATVREAAGNGDADAQLIQATWMLFGERLVRNEKEGRRLMAIAAGKGNAFAKAVAQLLAAESER